MAILVLLPLYSFEPLADHLGLGEEDDLFRLAPEVGIFHDLAGGDRLPPHSIFDVPELDDPVVGTKELKLASIAHVLRGPSVQELHVIYLLLKLDGLKVVELRLMRLNLSKVTVVEVPGVLNWAAMLEDNHAPGPIADC